MAGISGNRGKRSRRNIDGVVMQTCSKCLIEKPLLVGFARRADDYRATCRSCDYAYQASPEVRARRRKVYLTDEFREKRRGYYARPEVKERYKKYRSTPEYRKKKRVWERRRNACPDVKEKIRAYQRKFYATPEYRESERKRNKRRRMDIHFRLGANVGALIYQALKQNKNGKSWEKIVGYTSDKLKKHLESQFTEGMSWENYGEWHIDHIVPKSVFNYKTVKDIDFQRCWALENLRPLWARENTSKRDGLSKPFQPSLCIQGGACE